MTMNLIGLLLLILSVLSIVPGILAAFDLLKIRPGNAPFGNQQVHFMQKDKWRTFALDKAASFLLLPFTFLGLAVAIGELRYVGF